MNHAFGIYTLTRFIWSCDFNLDKCPIVKQCCRLSPYKEGAFTPNITSFATRRSSFFKIHGTSPSLKDQEGSTSPLLCFLGQYLFLVF